MRHLILPEPDLERAFLRSRAGRTTVEDGRAGEPRRASSHSSRRSAAWWGVGIAPSWCPPVLAGPGSRAGVRGHGLAARGLRGPEHRLSVRLPRRSGVRVHASQCCCRRWRSRTKMLGTGVDLTGDEDAGREPSTPSRSAVERCGRGWASSPCCGRSRGGRRGDRGRGRVALLLRRRSPVRVVAATCAARYSPPSTRRRPSSLSRSRGRAVGAAPAVAGYLRRSCSRSPRRSPRRRARAGRRRAAGSDGLRPGLLAVLVGVNPAGVGRHDRGRPTRHPLGLTGAQWSCSAASASALVRCTVPSGCSGGE